MSSFAPSNMGLIADPGDGGAIPTNMSGCCAITTTGVDDTRTVADPTMPGLFLTLTLLVDGGDAVIGFTSPINYANNNQITFANIQSYTVLTSCADGAGSLAWVIVANDGGVLASV